MVTLPERGHGFPECRVPMCPEDAGTREIVCYCRVRISGGEPEIIGNSSFSDAMPAEQVDIIILLLSDLALLARRRNGRPQPAGGTFHVERVIVRVVLITHPEQNVGVADGFRCLEGKYVALLVDVAERGDDFSRRFIRR